MIGLKPFQISAFSNFLINHIWLCLLIIISVDNALAQNRNFLVKNDTSWNLYDASHKKLLTINYDVAKLTDEADLILIYHQSQYGVMDLKGKFIIPLQNDIISYTPPATFLIKSLNRRKIIFDPACAISIVELDSVPYSFIIKYKDKFGIFDNLNERVIFPKYDHIISLYSNEIFKLILNTREFFYDAKTGHLSKDYNSIGIINSGVNPVLYVSNKNSENLYFINQSNYFGKTDAYNLEFKENYFIFYTENKTIFYDYTNAIIGKIGVKKPFIILDFYLKKTKQKYMLYTKIESTFDSLTVDSFKVHFNNVIIYNNGKSALLNKDGAFVIDFSDGEIQPSTNSEIFIIKTKKATERIFVDKQGNQKDKIIKLNLINKETNALTQQVPCGQGPFICNKDSTSFDFIKKNGDTLRTRFNIIIFLGNGLWSVAKYQNIDPDQILIRNLEGKIRYALYGLFDANSEKIVIPVNYLALEKMRNTKDFYLGVKMNGHHTIFSETGKKILDSAVYVGVCSDGMIRYNKYGVTEVCDDCASSLYRPLAPILTRRFANIPVKILKEFSHQIIISGGSWGYIENTGKMNKKMKFAYASDFIKDRALVMNYNGNYGVISKRLDTIISFKYKLISLVETKSGINFYTFKNSSKYGYLYNDEFYSDFKFDYCTPYLQYHAIVGIKRNYFILNNKGNVLGNTSYKKINNFKYGYAAVQNKKNLWGFIDSTGRLVIEHKFKEVGSFSKNGMAAVRSATQFGYINTAGEIVINEKFKKAKHFANNVAAVSMDGKTWGIIDSAGNWIKKPRYTMIHNNTTDTNVVLKTDDKWVLVKDSESIENVEYDQLSNFSEGLAKVHLDNKIGYINNKGTLVIPIKYKEGGAFAQNRTFVRNDDDCFLINKNDSVIHQYKNYVYSAGFKQNYAIVKFKDHYCLIDTNGNEIVKTWHRLIESNQYGFSLLKKNKKISYLSKNGSELFSELSYKDGLCPYNYNFPVKKSIKLDNYSNLSSWGLMDPFGEVYTGFCFKKIGTLSENNRSLKLDYFMGLVDYFGKTLIENECFNIKYIQDDIFSVSMPQGIYYYFSDTKKWLK